MNPPNSPTSAATSPAPAGGQSGAGTPAQPPLSPLHALAHMLAEEPSPGVSESQDAAPTSPAIGDPQEPVAGATEDGGEQNLTPEPTAEGETPEGDSPNPPSESDPSEPGPKADATSKATQKRIDALTAEKYRLRDENEALKLKLAASKPPESADSQDSGLRTQDSGLPPSIAKLTTLEQVQQRFRAAQSKALSLQKFLMTSSGEPDTVYDVNTNRPVNAEPDGKRFVTRQAIIDAWEDLTTELTALPRHAEKLTEQTRVTQAREQTRKQVLADFPWLGDPEHGETKEIAKMLESSPGLKESNAPEYWAAVMHRGIKSLNEELAARKGSGNGHAKHVFGSQARTPAPLGKVPLGKPSAPAGAAPPRPPADAAKVAAALDRNRKEGSVESLAELIAAGGL